MRKLAWMLVVPANLLELWGAFRTGQGLVELILTMVS